MAFIKITATACNSQGAVTTRQPVTEILLNIDLIAGFIGRTVLLKGGTILHAGNSYYRDFSLATGVNLPT